MTTEENQTIELKESIKLIKNTKGYQWEIKILDLDIAKLKAVDDKLRELYPQEMKGGQE